jgi:hypothetical protein
MARNPDMLILPVTVREIASFFYSLSSVRSKLPKVKNLALDVSRAYEGKVTEYRRRARAAERKSPSSSRRP